MGLASLSLWAFLGRGGEVIGFYLVPLIPLLALNVGLLFGSGANWLRGHLENHVTYGLQIGKGVQVIVTVLFLGLLSLGYLSPDLGFRSDPYLLWNNDQAVAQKQALTWIRDYVPPNDTLIMDNYL
jgi:hypothetical protein